MVQYACELHIEEIMDDLINEHETFPVIEKENSGTKCSNCSELSIYKVTLG